MFQILKNKSKRIASMLAAAVLLLSQFAAMPAAHADDLPATTVQVVKKLLPQGDGGKFNLRINNTIHAANAGDGGATGKIAIDPGQNVDIDETAGEDAALIDYTTSVECRGGGGQGDVVDSSNPAGSTSRGLIIEADKITPGDDIVCTITNTRKTGELTVVKDVVNDNGGTKTYADFTFTVGGQEYNFEETASPDGSKTISLPAGTQYAVAEPQENSGGYSTAYSGGCTGTITESQTQTCVITNDDQPRVPAPKNDNPAKIKVVKQVINDNGGHARAKDFKLRVNGTPVLSGATNQFDGKEWYYVRESGGPKGYKQTFSQCWDTTGHFWRPVGNPFWAKPGNSYFCKIINDDIAPKLKIIKDSHPNSIKIFDFTLEKHKFGRWWHKAGFQLNDNRTSWPVDNDKTFRLDAGKYKISEAKTNGWHLDKIKCWGDGRWNDLAKFNTVIVKLRVGQELTCKFENKKSGQIKGFKYEDVNKNGSYDKGEPKLSDWTITISKLFSPFQDSTVTDRNGWYKFNNLKSGWYLVCEVRQDGWLQTDPASKSGCQKVLIHPGDKDFVKFGNFQLGQVSGVKFNDANGNGQRDTNEPLLKDWEIVLTKKCKPGLNDLTRVAHQEECQEETWTATTNEKGEYNFGGLKPGYYKVCETQQANWTQTFPAADDGCHEFVIETSGQKVEKRDFGNKSKPQVLGEKDVKEVLAVTGASAGKNIAMGLVILSTLAAIHFLTQRRRDYAK